MAQQRMLSLIARVILPLAIAGSFALSPVPAASQDCKALFTSHAGSTAIVKSTREVRAKRRAKRRWERRVRREHGCQYARYENARNKHWAWYSPDGYLRGEPCRASGLICN